jgi:ketosteroid isomerase-like protein
MSTDDVETASRFLAALDAAVRTGDREPVYSLLAADVEWVVPERTLHGVGELREKHTWAFPPENLDVDLEGDDWVDLGEGRLATEVREVFRSKETDEIFHQRDLRIEVAIRDGKIRRYERHIVG